MHRASALTPVAVLAALALAACSPDGGVPGPSVADGNAAACPGDVVDVVVSVGQWSDVVQQLGGDCATVTTVVASSAIDPHDFEPSVGDIAAFSDAQLVVLNGGGYDTWAADAAGSLDSPPRIVTAADLDRTGNGDPHVWYEPDVVAATAEAVSEALAELSPEAADYLAGRRADWDTALDGYRATVEQMRAVATGHTYAATETVFDRMAAAVGLVDATPEGYRRAVSNDSDPAPGDLTEFERALAGGSVDVLVYNSQTSGSIPDQLREAAEQAGVPVVEVTESPPADGGSFITWQQSQLEALAGALGETP